MIQCSQKGKTPIWPMEEDEEDESLAETFSGMHVHFYREHLVTAFEEFLSPSGNLSRHLQMVHNNMH